MNSIKCTMQMGAIHLAASVFIFFIKFSSIHKNFNKNFYSYIFLYVIFSIILVLIIYFIENNKIFNLISILLPYFAITFSGWVLTFLWIFSKNEKIFNFSQMLDFFIISMIFPYFVIYGLMISIIDGFAAFIICRTELNGRFLNLRKYEI